MKENITILHMVSVREISDDKSTISSTRWAFATVIKFDIVMISFMMIAFIVCHVCGKELDSSIFYGGATLMGILTSLVTTSKALQGFEPKDKKTDDVGEGLKGK